ncbi:MAG TPA: hypothetical protein VF943_02395 [Burkholderiales bacterium]
MKKLVLLVLLAFSATAFAQVPMRIRATITGLNGDVLAVKTREGRDMNINLAPDAAVATAKSATLAELQGKYVGVTAKEKGGQMFAVEVHAIPPAAPAGHTPWDLEPGTTMTNANLEMVAMASGGNEITMTYKDGQKKIVVPPGTPIVVFAPGSRADLKPGETIFTIAQQQTDGRLTSARVSVSKDGVKPPQ